MSNQLFDGLVAILLVLGISCPLWGQEEHVLRAQVLDPSNALLDEGRFELVKEVADQAKDTAKVLASPAPDNPPIAYPDMRERRRRRYSAFDLSSGSRAESKIATALDEPTSFDFRNTPLADAVGYLREQQGIDLVLDCRAFADEHIDSSSKRITSKLERVTLRSALRLILHDLKLTYLVMDNSIMITPEAVAMQTLLRSIYPVGDLVLPIPAGSGGLLMQPLIATPPAHDNIIMPNPTPITTPRKLSSRLPSRRCLNRGFGKRRLMRTRLQRHD